MKKHVIPFLMALVCIIISLAQLPITAVAAGGYELTLHLEVDDQVPLQGVLYYLYQVGERTGDKGNYIYTLTEAFQDYEINLNELDLWNDTAQSLEDEASELVRYVEDNGIEAAKGPIPTDAKGDATFTDLSPGLYLALGEPMSTGNKSYYPQATLVAVPFPMPQDGKYSGKWINPVTIDVKAFGPPIDITVRKVWQGIGNPLPVTVQLLRDGKLYGSTQLHANNNWRYTWESLDSNHKWTVRENPIPNGWQADYTQNGNTITITNRSTTTQQNHSNPTPSNDPTNDPTSTSFGDEVSDDATPSDDLSWPDTLLNHSANLVLPQTSQLWWPVPLLIVLGVILLLTGAALFVQKEKSEEFAKPYE